MMHLEGYKFILFVSIIMLVGCSAETGKKDFPTINIDPEMAERDCLLSELATDVKVISLETNLDCIIDHFSELLYLDSENIIYKSGNFIIFFDGKGSFVNKISAVGKGPHEYVKILNATVDARGKLIYIVDNGVIKIYNFKGEFINKFASEITPSDIIKSKNGKFLIAVTQDYKEIDRNKLFIYDSLLNQVKSFKSKNSETIKVRQNFMGMGKVYKINDKEYYRNHINDTIFELIDNKLKPHWFLNIGKYKLNAEERLNISKKREAMNNNKIHVQDVLESLNYFFIRYSFMHNAHFVVYKKVTGECINRLIYNYDESKEYDGMVNFGIKNDLIENAPAFRPDYINGKTIVSSINPIYLNKEQRELFKCKEDDNPVLFVATFK